MNDETGISPTQSGKRFAWVRVWDLPTRVFHWLLVICVGVAWYLGDNRTFSNFGYHFYVGYSVAALLAFRILWGLVGPKSARLTALLQGPVSGLRYAGEVFKRSPSGTAGHNPLGSWSVLAMLASLIVQVATGLFAYDDGLFDGGPLSGYISEATILKFNTIHYWNSRVLFVLVGAHVFAAFFYLVWKRENLIGAMFTGRKLVKLPPEADDNPDPPTV